MPNGGNSGARGQREHTSVREARGPGGAERGCPARSRGGAPGSGGHARFASCA